MITIQDLLAEGYRRWENTAIDCDLYQKAIRDTDINIAFFMNVNAYDFSKFPNYTGPAIRFEVNNQIELEDGNTINISWAPKDDDTVRDLEDQMLGYWMTLGGKNYD